MRCWLAEIGAFDAHVGPELDAYFRARTALQGRLEAPRRRLARALRKLWHRSGANMRAAAEAMRAFEAAVEEFLHEAEALPVPDCLRAKNREGTEATPAL